MCLSSHPGCASVLHFKYAKGPLGKAPLLGWKIMDLPPEAQHLAAAWASKPSDADNGAAAQWDLMEFLAVNGIKSREVTTYIREAAIKQWCDGEDNKRCPREYRQRKAPKPPYLPWARDAWQAANYALGDEITDEEAPIVLRTVVANLTRLIESPTGCERCAAHWKETLKEHPVPSTATLDEARHWLVDRHNETREGKEPTAFEDVASRFNWTSPTPE